MKTALLAVLALLLGGCKTMLSQGVIEQASFDERCPKDQVHVLEWGPDLQSAKVDVCGKTRRYQAFVSGASDTSPGYGTWVQQPQIK